MAVKGFGVISGSSTVVAKILEDGTIRFGQDIAADIKMSGSLVLNLGSEATDRYLRTDANGTASWSQVAASEVSVTPSGNLTSTDVQSALEELQDQMDGVSDSGSIVFSDGTNSGTVNTDGSTLTIQGTANEATVGFAGSTYTVGLPDDVIITNNLTVQNDLVVNGTSTFLNTENLFVEDPLITLASGNAAQTLDQGLVMTRSGSNYAMIWDESSDEFAFIETSEDGTTAGNVAITSYAPLQIGDLTAVSGNLSGDLTVQGFTELQGGLQVTGAVNLPNASIENQELVNSTIRIDLGAGLTSSLGDPFDVALGGTASFAFDSATLGFITFSGTANEIDINGGTYGTASLGETVTIGLPDNVEITNNLFVTGNLEVTGSTYLGTDGNDETIINSKFRIPVFTTGTIPSEYVNSPENYAGHMFYLSGAGSSSGDFQTGNKWYQNENGEWYKSFFFPGGP